MTFTQYNEFSIYLKYLEVMQNNALMYIPDLNQQILAKRMADHIVSLVG